MAQKKNKVILILGSSGQASLSVIKCLRLANLATPKYRIITEDLDPLLPGAYVGDVGYINEKDDDKWIAGINKIIAEEKVDLVIPCHDIPVDIISRRRDEIKAPILLAQKEKIEITRDKWLFNHWLKLNGYPAPRTHLGLVSICPFPEYVHFPVIVKPRKGFGSKDQYIINSQEEMEALKELFKTKGIKEEDYITQEKLEGMELSGMALVSKDGEILSITCAESVKKFGMSYKTIHGGEEDHLDFKLLVAKIIGRMGITGPVSVQGFRTTSSVRSTSSLTPYGDIKIFETNPRFTGAQIIRAMGGVNGPEILIDNWLEGTKSYPLITGKFVAFWYADYLYATNRHYEELKTNKKIKRCAVGEILL
jgi:carbamoyl-phosphate synthase large subunit